MDQKTEEYPWVRAWGELMGSYQYYIKDQIARAKAAGAPQTAVYQPANGPSTEWVTLDAITSSHTQRQLIIWADNNKIHIPSSVVQAWHDQSKS